MKTNGIKVPGTSSEKKIRPALTPEARENQMISLAIDLAERQLLEGTASSQVITHFLKLGSSREKLEQETMKKNQELIDAKKLQLESEKRMEDLYAGAIAAMRTYSGNDAEATIDTVAGDDDF